jgi:exosortase C (VPDSG-CTERM-specific)
MAESPLDIAVPAKTQREPSGSCGRFWAFVVFAALLALVFLRPLVGLVVYAAGSKLNSHVILIPFVSIYLVYINRRQLPETYIFKWGWTLLFLLIGLGVAILEWSLAASNLSESDSLALSTLAFVCLLAGGGFFFLGTSWMKATTFAWWFLIFMIPMPEAMANTLEIWSMNASATAANMFFDLGGPPHLREGTLFQLPNITIRVAEECSGIRSSWVLFITSLLAAHLFLCTTWKRLLLVCFVIPLGVLRNGFRVWVIGSLCVHFGPQMIDSPIHRRGGPVFFVLSLIPLFLLVVWLRRHEPGTMEGATVSSGESKQESPDPAASP